MQKGPSAQKLQKILETTNERDLFLVGHMYIENTIDRILEKNSISLQNQLIVHYSHQI